MAAPVHGKNGVVYYDKYNLSPYLNDAAPSSKVDKAETTTFGVAGGSKTYLAGLNDGSVKVGGYWDGSAGAIDAILTAAFGTVDKALTIGANGDTLGNRAVLCQVNHIGYDTPIKVGAAVAISAEFAADGGIQWGVWQHKLQAETVTANGTSIDGGAASAAGWSATLHVTAVTGTTPSGTVKIQDSADNTTFADLAGATFTAATAATSQYLSVGGTAAVRRYVRAAWTITGTTPSLTFAVGFCRR